MKYNFYFLLFCFSLISSISTWGQLNYQYESLPCLEKKITILPHIVLNQAGNADISEEDITEAIDSVNAYFEPICVSFEICGFDTITNWQFNFLDDPDEWNDMIVKYHEANRINMFFVSQTTSPTVCGFATLSGVQRLESGGIVIRKEDCIGGNLKTIHHEMGHYFGLLHTFEGNGIELVDGSNCLVTGDSICDTPADPYVEDDPLEDYLLDCRFISEKIDANGQYYVPDVGNIMSYYSNNCTCGFTHQQYLRMARTYETALSKVW